VAVFNDSLPTQDVAVAPGRSVVWMGCRYVASEVILGVPTAEAESLALAGFVVAPSQALTVLLSASAQATLGADNVEAALLMLMGLLAPQ
jgi:hypothetical protein